MIIPNLPVEGIARAIAFYRGTLGMTLNMVVFPDRTHSLDPDHPCDGAAFAMLEREGSQMMLQTRESLAADLPDETFSPAPGGVIYLRSYNPDDAVARADPECVIKGPFDQWYGMREAYLRDPDGHIVCVAMESDGGGAG